MDLDSHTTDTKMYIPSLECDRLQIEKAFRIALGDIVGNTCRYKGGIIDEPRLCILAGMDYDRPWTRDAAINAWNAGAFLYPSVARDTLLSVLEFSGKDLFIGGQYWDALIWSFGALTYYYTSGDEDFLTTAYQAIANSLRRAEQSEY